MKYCSAILWSIVFVVSCVKFDPITESLNGAPFPGQADFVRSLPNVTLPTGQNYSSVGHYWGQMQSSIESISMHYWFFKAQSDNWQAAPLVLWLGGWVSTLNWALNGISPIQMNPNGTLSLNEHSWNKKANLLFLESFFKVGFLSKESYLHSIPNDTSAAKFTFHLLGKFYEKYQFLTENDLFLAGEGYTSFHITILAKELVDRHYPPNFKGIIIGNGVFNTSAVVNAHFQYVHNMEMKNLYSTTFWNNLTNFCCPREHCSNDSCTFQDCQTFTSENNYVRGKEYITVHDDVVNDDDGFDATAGLGTPFDDGDYNDYDDFRIEDICGSDNEFCGGYDAYIESTQITKPNPKPNSKYNKKPNPIPNLNPYPKPNPVPYPKPYPKPNQIPQQKPIQEEPLSECKKFYLNFYKDLKRRQVPLDLHNIREKCISEIQNLTCTRYIVTKNIYDWLKVANKPTRKAHNIETNNWKPGNIGFCSFYRQYPTLNGHLMFLLLRNVRVLLYTGEFDGIVPFYNTDWLLNDLSLKPTKSGNEEWKFENNSAGYRTRFCEGLSRYEINGAGHTVAEDKPAQTLKMIKEFLFDDNSASDSFCPANDQNSCTKHCSTEPLPAERDGFCFYWIEYLYRYFVEY